MGILHCRGHQTRNGDLKITRHDLRTASVRQSDGFTLIEILVVLVVIATLAGLVAPNVFRHVGTAQVTAAKSQIEMLAAALDSYRLDMGRYPTTAEGLAVLWTPLPDGSRGDWRGPYLRKSVPMDPWGNAFVYTSPSVTMLGGFDLVSYGADGASGGTGVDADIVFGE